MWRSSRCRPSRAKDLGREVELRLPVVDDLPAVEIECPGVHLLGNLGGYLKKHGIPMNGQLEVPLIVQRHRVDLTEGIFPVEHPAVGT